jgi:hypothetical protein
MRPYSTPSVCGLTRPHTSAYVSVRAAPASPAACPAYVRIRAADVSLSLYIYYIERYTIRYTALFVHDIEEKEGAETWSGVLACKWNKSRTGANLEGRPKASYDGLELAERFGAKICKISRV